MRAQRACPSDWCLDVSAGELSVVVRLTLGQLLLPPLLVHAELDYHLSSATTTTTSSCGGGGIGGSAAPLRWSFARPAFGDAAAVERALKEGRPARLAALVEQLCAALKTDAPAWA